MMRPRAIVEILIVLGIVGLLLEIADDVARFLIPAAALAAAARGDRGSSVRFDCPADPDKPVLKLTATCGRMPVEATYQPEPVSGFPVRPAVQGRITAVPRETLVALQTVAGCAFTDATRYVLNGVLFTPDDGGKPPVIAFAPGYLAEALTIGPTLRLIDGISPGMAVDPSGNFCVLMPCRCVAEDAHEVIGKATATAVAA